MLQLTLESGQVVQRVFAGFITSQDDLEKLIGEMRAEVKDNDTGNPLLCEIWKDATPKKEVVKSRRKMVLAS